MISDLNLIANIQESILRMIHKSASSHIGSCLSIVHLLYTLYFKYLKIDPLQPKADGRDIFILSKAHGSAALYAVLAERGFFSKSILMKFYIDGGLLPGHLDKNAIPGVETSGGSLGHGLAIAIGFSISAKIKKKSIRIVTLLGDGECNEGSVWEGVMLASALQLTNLTVIIDNNNLQGFGRNVLHQNNLAERFKAFGWETLLVDGHSINQIVKALESSQSGPKAIIANTIKGKGVSFMEDKLEWHYKSPNDQQLADSIVEIRKER
jgi:transketolase